MKTTSALWRTNRSRMDTRTNSAWRCVSGAVPCFVLHARTDEVSQMVKKYASGVVIPAPLSWYAVLIKTCDMYALR